jgi:hypothetical protein
MKSRVPSAVRDLGLAGRMPSGDLIEVRFDPNKFSVENKGWDA